MWTGGHAGVAIFFVLFGCVLSVGTLRKLKSEKTREARRGILSAFMRRPIRLYFLPLAVSFLATLLLHVPGLLLPEAFNAPQPSVGSEILNWFKASTAYLSIFRNHVIGGYFYNSPVWTLPVELKGSLLVYAVLVVLSLGVAGVDHKVPLMMAVVIFTSAAIMLQIYWKWSMAEFL